MLLFNVANEPRKSSVFMVGPVTFERLINRSGQNRVAILACLAVAYGQAIARPVDVVDLQVYARTLRPQA